MKNRLFICTYNNINAFEKSKQHNLLGFSTKNTGAKGSILKLQPGDLVFVRDKSHKDLLSCFGIFKVTGSPYEPLANAELIWDEEIHEQRVIHTLRVPVSYIDINVPDIPKSSLLNLHWKKRESPFNEYKWQGLSRLFAVNFLTNEQSYQLEKLWGIELDNLVTQWLLPEEIISPEGLSEGAKKQIVINAFERNQEARDKCINHYGFKCVICDFDFSLVYGELGKEFIHVHHIIPLSAIGESYIVNPIEDLRPVCPNCHAMLHRKEPPYQIEGLREILNNQRNK